MHDFKKGAIALKNRTDHEKRKSGFTRKFKRCLASAACVVGVAAVCLGVAGYQNKIQAEDDQVVTRGVVKSLGQIPQTKKDMYDQGKNAKDYENVDMTLGSKSNPFLILEIVPSEAYAEFGYHISGCEPVDMEEAALMDNSPVYTINGSINEGTIEQVTAYFFPDEIRKDLQSKYSNKIHKYGNEYGKEYKGYYACVENGTGNFIQNEDGSFSKSDNGNFIWHTINSFEESKYKDKTFSEENNAKVSKVGKRVYTMRINSEEDPIDKIDNYVSFVNKDVFLKDTLQKETIEQIENYGIIIKTITPKELNKNPAWADYADFYVVSTESHNSGLVDAWKRCNRVGNTSDVATDIKGFENTSNNKEKDISWAVAKKMYDKVTADINYAAIAMDANTYGSSLNGESVKYIKTDILDWNMRPTGQKDEADRKASNNNMYKLTIMLISMRPNLFKQLYLKGYEKNESLISQNGKFIAQTGDAQDYWTMFTFYPSEKSDSSELPGNSWYNSWADVKNWPEYQMPGNIEIDGSGNQNNRNYVNNSNRLFTYNNGNTMTSVYESGDLGTNSADIKYEDFRDFLDKDKKDKATPSDAVRFILGTNSNPDNGLIEGNLKVLDIEPGYDRENGTADSENGYFLKESYVYLMLPRFKGSVTITHMTTAEFIGSAEDLNSKYNMIYIGMDSSAYNHDADGSTVWNDSAMKGKIYFHTGDKLEANPNYKMDRKDFSVSYLWSKETKTAVSGNTIRFSGNDITTIKEKELEKFLQAGYPVVADSYLYNTDITRIDQHSNICDFIIKNKSKDNLLETNGEKEKFYNAIKQARSSAVFIDTPKLYNGKTDENDLVNDPNYLECNEEGHVLLPFSFRVVNADGIKFKYRIYLDQNQDGKFDDDELYYKGEEFDAEEGQISHTCQLSSKYMGLIQWKIEVYQSDNEQVHFSKTGCSAAQIKNPEDRKVINVLQIMPDAGSYQGKLDLSSNTHFTKYYNKLNDYEIKVTTMTLDEFEKEFTSENPFTYDYSKEPDDDTCDQIAKNLTEGQRKLYDYNMFIIGFGDRFAKKNLSNENGAVDFIKFYIACGKSVLFTHDLTSFFNINSSDYGYTANTFLRDVMGMNRYGAVSSKLTEVERKQLIDYQAKLKYDTVTDLEGNPLEQKHGYTYYAMRRLALGTSASNQKMPYNYLLKNSTYKDFEHDNAGRTKKVTRTNEGQITQYPYKIPENLTVAYTHGQYYQLDMEDPNVTVWYCLADDNNSMAAMYGVSPNDAANNYYIYSKENVFYSGVGDNTINSDDEAKLFINTMIAAYRASYEAPMFQILNDEAEVSDREKMNYSMIAGYQEYNDGEVSQDSEESDEKIKIYFSPEDFNAITPMLTGMIYYENEDGTRDYVKTIYDAETNRPIDATEIQIKSDNTAEQTDTQTAEKNTESKWSYQDDNMVSMHKYYFYYPKKYLNNKTRRTIHFYIKNDKSKLPRYQTLDLSVSALFKLD